MKSAEATGPSSAPVRLKDKLDTTEGERYFRLGTSASFPVHAAADKGANASCANCGRSRSGQIQATSDIQNRFEGLARSMR
jgi:hypothetical protein